jgi:transposase
MYKSRRGGLGMQAAAGAAHLRSSARDGARVASRQGPIFHSGEGKVSEWMMGSRGDMDERGLFRMALGLEEPWDVTKIEFSAEEQRLDIHLDFPRGSKFACPECRAACGVYDTAEQSWRHLNFFQHTTYLHARHPRVECESHGVKRVMVPWARPGAGFTLLFEALIMLLARNNMTPKGIARLVGEHDTRIWRVLEHYVDASLAKQDQSQVTKVGVDETSRAKGHDYVSLFADMDERKVIFVAQGKDHETVKEFKINLEAHGGKAESITDFSLDMSQAFIKGITEEFENSHLTFDKFHVIKLMNDAVDKVRREEQRTRPELKGTRYVWLKNDENLTDNQREVFNTIRLSTLRTAKAFRIRETLQDLYAQKPTDAESFLRWWYFWATHSRLDPVIKVAKTIKAHWDGVMRWFESRLNNGLMEGINSLVQAAKARARGYRSTRKMKVMIYLIAGKLDFDLPNVLHPVTHTK